MGRPGSEGPVFIDETRIFVEAGKGGDGSCSFRREKYVPRGGPDGGCGGHGGSVILVATPAMDTLYFYHRHRNFRAEPGGKGEGQKCTGKTSEDLVLDVPLGTVVRTDEGAVLADLCVEGERFVAARGGRGGRGNKVFATSRRQAPRFAEKGEPGEERWLKLELRVIAQVGLIGYPNVGKSTLLSRVSAARPKIAAYPFTTLEPTIGVVPWTEYKTFTMADLPGLIEGAAEGKGLGDRFLKHAERTNLLVHVLDASGYEGRDPAEDYRIIRAELGRHHESLLKRPEVVVANKLDLPGASETAERLRRQLGVEVVGISAVTGEGVEALVKRIGSLVESLPRDVPREQPVRVHRPEAPFTVTSEDGGWRLSGRAIERLFAMTDLTNEEAVYRTERILLRLGVYRVLMERGCQEGDLVRVGEQEFHFDPPVETTEPTGRRRG